jgi:hypothetical protein
VQYLKSDKKTIPAPMLVNKRIRVFNKKVAEDFKIDANVTQFIML